MKRNEFERDLHIDVEALDVEAAMQGDLFFKWAEKAVEARKVSERSKLNVDVLVAELGSKIRKNPEKYKVEKVTEGAITAAIHNHDDYKEAQDTHLDNRADLDLLNQAVIAMEQKKRMIESLITLHGQQYFASPSVPHSLPEAYAEKMEERGVEVIKKTKIRKRKK